MENPHGAKHCDCITATWLGTWQYLKVGRLGSQTRSLCKLALLLGHERFAVLNVAPDVGVARSYCSCLECGEWAVESHPNQSYLPGHAEEKNPSFEAKADRLTVS